MILWIVEIPIIVYVIAAMLIGSIQIGHTLRVLGVILLLIGAVLLVISFCSEGKKRAKTGLACVFFIFNAILFLAIGVCFGEHNLFEFLFGTGWF